MHSVDRVNNPENAFVRSLIDFTAGSLGGAAQVYVSQPLDTVKVKQQAFPKLYKNMFHCFIETYRKDGIVHGLYAGSVPAVVANVAENSVLFAAYGSCQKAVAALMNVDNTADLPIVGNAFAGFLAAFFSTFALCPTELIKCRLQALRETGKFEAGTATVKHVTALELCRDIYKNEGVRGFFRGLTPTFFREMPGYFFFFGGYEATRLYFTKPGQTKDDIGPLRTMIAGAVGGTCLWTMIFPADVIKSRMQVSNVKGGMLRVGVNIARNEGILALYNGLLPSVLRTIPATATLFLVYEYTKKAFNNAL